jgi:hypothetical protein
MQNEVADERPATGQYDDLRCCLEYAASRVQNYVKPVRRAVKTPLQLMNDELDKIFRPKQPQAGTIHFGRALT